MQVNTLERRPASDFLSRPLSRRASGHYRVGMTNPPRVEHEYIVEYVDGPLAGTTDRRLLINGGAPDERIGSVAAIEGLESLFWYVKGAERLVNSEKYVAYHFDAPGQRPGRDRQGSRVDLSRPGRDGALPLNALRATMGVDVAPHLGYRWDGEPSSDHVRHRSRNLVRPLRPSG